MADDTAWIEEAIGGTVTRFERITGGASRGTWIVDVERPGGELIELIFRRDTGDGPLSGTEISMAREATTYRALDGTGVKVAKLWAVTPEKDGLLVSRLPGTGDFNGLTAQQREEVLASFFEEVARLHSLDTTTLDLPGFRRPTTPEEHALCDLDVWQGVFESRVRQKVPIVRWAFDWLRRNPPTSVERTVLCHGDCGGGNYLHHEGKVTALIDLEFVHLGDPMDDLAWITFRGGLAPDEVAVWFRRYADLTGTKVDAAKIRYYRVFVFVRCAVACLVALDGRTGNMDTSTYYNLHPALQVQLVREIAALEGVELPPAPAPEDAGQSADAEVLDTLLSDLTTVITPALNDATASQRAMGMTTLLAHLQAADRLGASVERGNLDDMASVLDHRPASVAEGQAELDDLVRQSGAARTAELLPVFDRMAARLAALWPVSSMMAVMLATPGLDV